MTFHNMGTQPAAITEMSLLLPISDGHRILKWKSFDDGQIPVNTISLNPGDMVHKRVIFPYSKSELDSVRPEKSRENFHMDVLLRITVISSSGKTNRELDGIRLKVRGDLISGTEYKRQRIELLQ